VAHPRTAELLAPDIVVDRFLEEGDVFQTGQHTWNCLHTPGHATGHLCFHNTKTGALVVGDMVAGEGTIVLDPPEGNLSDYLASLNRLLALGARILFPAHGPPLDDPAALLQYYLDHRMHRTEQVRQAAKKREKFLAADLVGEIYADLPRKFWPIAERQVLCHLQFLVSQGELLEGATGFQSSSR
jgi:glyoxylase-like metal-dependent hydrolase (beta-lactamase superfamily II)